MKKYPFKIIGSVTTIRGFQDLNPLLNTCNYVQIHQQSYHGECACVIGRHCLDLVHLWTVCNYLQRQQTLITDITQVWLLSW